ncbi:MAG: hypothetical protein M0030_08265 [Actinomycetota bacterium]|nr:hypothetical protein [Actinomycetota bacterium]
MTEQVPASQFGNGGEQAGPRPGPLPQPALPQPAQPRPAQPRPALPAWPALPWPVLIAMAADPLSAERAVAAGADIVDLTWLGPDAARDFLTRHPGVRFCAGLLPGVTAPAGAGATPLAGQLPAGRHPALSRHLDEAGPDTLLVCDSVAAAGAAGLPPPRMVVMATPADLPAVTAAGLAAWVDADLAPAARPGPGASGDRYTEPALTAGCAATAALATWLGAALLSTRHPVEVRRAIDMTAAIAGWRRPARTVRGLA